MPRKFLSLLALTLASCWFVNSADAAPKLPNIVIVLADDMGYGDPGCYNPESKIPTPHIDRLAREGMRFTDAHAPASVCVPSRFGLLSGRYPFRQRIQWKLPGVNLQADAPTLPKLLKSAGYQTVCVGKWHLGFQSEHPTKAGQQMSGGPKDVGFDYFFGMWASLDIPPYYYIENDRCVAPPSDRVEASSSPGVTPIQGAFWRAGGIAPGLKHVDVMPTFVNKATSAIERHAKDHAEQPLFLYMPLPAPHTPWVPTDEHREKSKAGEYGDYTHQVDAALGAVIKQLEQEKMLDDTLLVFTSDNGPTWYEADVERYQHRSAGPLRGMKGDLWEAGHRIPFVVRWPQVIKPGTKSAALLSFTDFQATCAELTGQPLDEESQFDSISFLPVLRDSEIESPRQQMLHTGGGTVAVRDGKWKLIPGLGSYGFSKPRKEKPTPDGPRGQLYDLNSDVSESNNLWLEHPEIVERLMRQIPAK